MTTNAFRKFLAPEFVFGEGSLALAGQFARNLGAARVLLVSDRGVNAAGWTRLVADSLERAGMEVVEYAGVTANPRTEEVMAGADRYLAEECDAIIAVGGGSPIDCAKGIGIVSAGGRHILDAEGVDNVNASMPPMISVPTTGSSADVSQFAIFSDRARMRKFAVISKAVVPDVSLIDPRCLTTLEPHLAVSTAMDALTHGIEAFLSTGHSAITDIHALEAVRLISSHLEASLADPADMALRENTMLASLHAGLAFSNASLGAVHAMAHSLGGRLDLPHGVCNALLLERVIEFNFPAAEDRCRRIAEALGVETAGLGSTHVKAVLVERIRKLKTAAGIDRTLAGLGVTPSEIGDLAENAMRDPCLVTNPRVPNRRDIAVIYEEAL